MRRYIIGLAVFAIVGAGAYAVFAGVQRNKSCTSSAQPTAGSTCSPSAGATPSEAPRGAILGNFDPAMSGVCRFACATKLKYKAADVLVQPGAQPGKLAQCPVSGVVFVVDPSRPHVRVAGTDFVACCGNCAAKLQGAPGHYLKI